MGRHEKRILAGAMALARCKTIGQFNELPRKEASSLLLTSEKVINASDRAIKRGCTPEVYLAATKGD